MLPPEPTEPEAPATAVILPKPKPVPPPRSAYPPEPEAATSADEAEVAFDPNWLIGLSGPETESLLGRPESEEKRGPAKVWRYAAEDCVLNLVLYVDLKTVTYRVLRVKIETEPPSDAPSGRCVSQIAKAGRPAL